MPNSIRSLKRGASVTPRRIAQAVDNEEWKMFRLSMKGKSTEQKLEMLQQYWTSEHNPLVGRLFYDSATHFEAWTNCDICIRVDNYIKALCRGGQLYPGESLMTALAQDWKLSIKRN